MCPQPESHNTETPPLSNASIGIPAASPQLLQGELCGTCARGLGAPGWTAQCSTVMASEHHLSPLALSALSSAAEAT